MGSSDDLGDCITAVELHQTSYDKTCELVRQALRDHGLDARDTKALCQRWLRQGDFLLMPLEQSFTHAIGNPPYVRQELIPDVLMTEYRRRFSTIYDRADIYVPFIERSLSLLAPGGQLGFICADRWMKNRYGGPLRRLIAEKFHLRYFVDMVDTNAFHSDVIAYPAIVVISREKQKATRIAFRPAINASELQGLSRAMLTPKLGKDKGVSEIATVARGCRAVDARGARSACAHSSPGSRTSDARGCRLQGRHWCGDRRGSGLHRAATTNSMSSLTGSYRSP